MQKLHNQGKDVIHVSKINLHKYVQNNVGASKR